MEEKNLPTPPSDQFPPAEEQSQPSLVKEPKDPTALKESHTLDKVEKNILLIGSGKPPEKQNDLPHP